MTTFVLNRRNLLAAGGSVSQPGFQASCCPRARKASHKSWLTYGCGATSR